VTAHLSCRAQLPPRAATMSKATESWADWILSSYSESINPPPAEAPPPPSPESDSSDVSPDTSSSPWGPYTKTGRGGAGNITWQSDLPPDVEAQHQPSLRNRQTSTANSEAADRAEKIGSKKRPINIVTGRGGAGNFVPATYAPGTPRSPTWPISPNSPPSATPRTASAVYGRGGAGNFAASSLALSQAKDEKADEERKMAEDLREKAEHDVENMLKPPEGAFLAGTRRRESGVGA
jgi:hypothetical protein